MKKVLSIFGGIISFVVCAILLLVQISFLTFMSFKSLLNEKTLLKMLDKIDVVEVLDKNIDPSSKEEIYKVSGSLGLTIDETDKIINSKSLKEFAAAYVSSNIKAIYSDSTVVIGAEDIKELINDVEKETNITIKDKDKLITMINENSTEIEKNLNISQIIKSELDEESMLVLSTLMSGTIYVGFAVIFVFFFLILALFRWSIYKPFIWYGITSIISGLLFLIPSFSLAVMLPYMLNEELMEYKVYFTNVIKVIQTNIILYAVLTIVLGVIMIVVYSLIKKNKNKEKENFKALDDDFEKNSTEEKISE